jgi:hypothetical protein
MLLGDRPYLSSMHRHFTLGLLIITLLAGCGTTAMDSESTREIVLQYLGIDAAVGTAGPFGKGGKKEIDVLSAADRKQVEALIDRGAVLFLVYAVTPAAAGESPAPGSNVSRVIVVQGGKVVGDFRAAARPAA